MRSDIAAPPETIPVIDVAALRSDDAAACAAVAAQIAAACRTSGFFYIVGHGVDAALIDELFAQTRAFFAQSLDAKLALAATDMTGERGYEPLRAQTLEPGMPPDLKESFLLGREPELNLWPGLPGWRATMERYAAEMRELARVMLRGMALSLDLPPDRFESFGIDPIATLRLLHYPEQPANPSPGEKGCGAHTDWGSITFLLQDDAGGLHVRGPNGWIDAAPIPGSFVVNIGDMMARWTNDRYRSTLHRVINVSGRPRYSIPFFFDGPPAYEVVCFPSCLGPGEAPRYPPITVGEHLAAMRRRSYETPAPGQP
jgi:isopenicillin N synthase-like dioxygenase